MIVLHVDASSTATTRHVCHLIHDVGIAVILMSFMSTYHRRCQYVYHIIYGILVSLWSRCSSHRDVIDGGNTFAASYAIFQCRGSLDTLHVVISMTVTRMSLYMWIINAAGILMFFRRHFIDSDMSFIMLFAVHRYRMIWVLFMSIPHRRWPDVYWQHTCCPICGPPTCMSQGF